MFECMIKYVYFNISTLIMVQMCLFYAIEKKWIQNVSMCTISTLQFIALGSPQLLFIKKYQQNIYFISIICIYFIQSFIL